MPWSDETMHALNKWLGPSTWHKNHGDEDRRFHLFVASVWNDEHKIWDEATAREVIVTEAVKLHSGSEDMAREVASERVSKGTTILDFLSHLDEANRLSQLAGTRVQ